MNVDDCIDGSSTLDDLDPRLSLSYGRQLLIEDIIARLAEVPGGLWYDASYGAGLLLLLNENVDTALMRRTEAYAEQQCRMDERVEAAQVVISKQDEQLFAAVSIQATNSVALEFTVLIDDVTKELLRI